MNFGNFTNNKTESHNEKIKLYLTPKMHIPESVQNLIRAVKDTYDRLAYNNFMKLKPELIPPPKITSETSMLYFVSHQPLK